MNLHPKYWLAAMLFGALSLPVAGTAGERVYGAEPVESQWRVVSDSYQCRMEHDIPQFGRAAFVQPADGALRFELRSWRPQKSGTVAVRAIPPEWRPGFPIVELGSVALESSRTALRVEARRAEWLLAELEQGIYPAFFYPETTAGRGGVSVVISGVRFRDAFKAFLNCRGGLLKMDVASLRARTLHFASNQSALSEADRRALAEFALFARSGGSAKQVVVEAYADASGSTRYNQRLAQRRARTVRDFLVSQGLNRTQISTRSFGEAKPLASNRTEQGRSQNRRAIVRVIN